MANLYSTLSAGFTGHEGRRFAVLPDGTALTYGDLDARSAAFANTLVGLGVGVGDRVAVQADKSVDMLLLYLG